VKVGGRWLNILILAHQMLSENVQVYKMVFEKHINCLCVATFHLYLFQVHSDGWYIAEDAGTPSGHPVRWN
jgi:hypothetical protein